MHTAQRHECLSNVLHTEPLKTGIRSLSLGDPTGDELRRFEEYLGEESGIVSLLMNSAETFVDTELSDVSLE